MKLIKWLGEFLDESTTKSFSRLITLVIVAFILGWDTQYVRIKQLLPDAATMLGQGAFMTLFYGVRRIAGAYTDTKLGANPQETISNGTGTGQAGQQ